jgi:hypothetical protein
MRSLLLAVVVAACLGCSMAQAALLSSPMVTDAELRDFYKGLETTPGYGPIWTQLGRDFPAELKTFSLDAIRRFKVGDLEGAKSSLSANLRRFLADNTAVIGRASDADLVRLNAASLQLARLAQARNTQVCATFVTTGLQDPDLLATSEAERAAVLQRGLAILQAIKSGRDAPVARAALTSEQTSPLLARLKSLPNGKTLADLFSGRAALQDQPAPLQCAYGVALLDAVSRAPADVQGRVVAVLFFRMGGDYASASQKGDFSRPARAVLDELEADPQAGASFKLMEDVFPAQMMAITEDARVAGQQGGVTAFQKSFTTGYRVLVDAHRSDTNRAPDADLVRLSVALAKMYRVIQAEGEERCAMYAMQGVAPPEPYSPAMTYASLEVQKRVVEAITDARKSPTDRSGLQPEDLQQLAAEMLKAKVSPEIVNALSQHGLNKLDMHSQCEGTTAVMEAIGRLPPDAAARWMATIFQAAGELKSKSAV